MWAIYRFSLKEDNKKGGKNTFTCVACHPNDDCIATGHEDGKIRLWWVKKKQRDLEASHSHPVFGHFEQLFSLPSFPDYGYELNTLTGRVIYLFFNLSYSKVTCEFLTDHETISVWCFLKKKSCIKAMF